MAFSFVVPKPSSFIATIVLLILVSPSMSVQLDGSSNIEYCLRRRFSPPPPPPPAVGSPMSLDIGSIVCRDIFRAEMFYLRETGKLSFEYLKALCNVLGDNEAKVGSYIGKSFPNYDVKRLMGGNSCRSIGPKPKPPPPSV